MDGAGLATQFGMINNLRTGNVVVDTLVCFLIPVIIGWLTRNSQTLSNRLMQWLNKVEDPNKGEYVRTIEHVEMRTSWGSRISGEDEKNNILQKAITLYLADQAVDYKKCDLNLTAIKGRKYRYNLKKGCDSDDESDNEPEEDAYGNTATQLKAYRIHRMPPPGQWVEVEDNIRFRQSVDGGKAAEESKKEESRNPMDNSKRIVFEVSSSAENGAELVEEFVQKAYDRYTTEIERQAKKDKSRYLYLPRVESSTSSDSDSGDKVPKYKRYKLGENKTFKSLFFKEKPALMSLLDDFLGQTGKYAIEGYPYKLGLLLHGPPGTGKTSLIKALAHYTKRSIVSIPLSKLRTNQQLMDMMMDQKFSVTGEDMDIRLSFKNTIFVMEDVDCAGKVVTKRTSDESVEVRGGSDGVSMEGPMTQDQASSSSGSDKDGSDLGNFMKALIPDRLDLGGLLNVLDGVVDCPGRMLILTSNHPEKLDPALIRPGRIDKKLELGALDATTAAEMIEHYFQSPMHAEDTAMLDAAMAGDCKLTPAELEQQCSEHELISSLVQHLAGKPSTKNAIASVDGDASAPEPALPAAQQPDEEIVSTDPFGDKSGPVREASVPHREASASVIEAVEAA
eukprot:m.352401 g.352401  ORF g.352401 m.352401 type:complete len:620 (-) comp20708_c0_seq1:305-2164(-)